MMADIVLPATMFMEHDDLYQGGGHQHIMLGPKLVDPPGECRSNHEVVCGLAERVGAEHPRLRHEPARDSSTGRCSKSGWGTLEELEASRCTRRAAAVPTRRTTSTASPIRTGNSASGRIGRRCRAPNDGRRWARGGRCRRCRTIGPAIEEATDEHPFRLATSPARQFLNSTFNETPTSLAKERRPEVMIHPEDARALSDRERRLGAPAQRTRRGADPRPAVRGRAARRADRGVRSGRTPHFPTAAASTRSPAPTRSRPMAARPSTTTAWRWSASALSSPGSSGPPSGASPRSPERGSVAKMRHARPCAGIPIRRAFRSGWPGKPGHDEGKGLYSFPYAARGETSAASSSQSASNSTRPCWR